MVQWLEFNRGQSHIPGNKRIKSQEIAAMNSLCNVMCLLEYVVGAFMMNKEGIMKMIMSFC